MTPILFLASAATMLTPAEPLAGKLRAAIWSDLQLNAMIGNGNWVASLWYNAGKESPATPDLHIENLACRNHARDQRCAFNLFRDGGVKTVLGETAPDRLTCEAILAVAQGGDRWEVKHLPPRHIGHSRTTMVCIHPPA
ncbi:hypothetical protein [Aquisediminimonas profunda]|uniref:hypothetical protein n=1 Tax=Aquisediminimonas profunda TaxID=1550733 RepID=UPI001C62FA54|nr:hypothetical protein [Aquisediminimonas profunda]